MIPPLASEAPAWATYTPVAPAPAPLIHDPALPLVSVVTPSLNQGRFIDATISSVLGQEYPNIEYWVIDGGSTDKTLETLRSYASDLRLHWLSEPDCGQADAINKGWARCQGQILAWLNADDTYLPGAVAAQVAALLDAPEAGAVYGDALFTDADGRPLRRIYGRPYSPLALLRLEIPAQPTVFLRRGLVARLGPLDIGKRYSMDTAYWARAARLTPFARTPVLAATYRLHAESKSVGQTTGFYNEWLEIAEAFFAAPETPAELRAARGGVLADIYAAMANLEARRGALAGATRYLAYALFAGGPRPRMLKLPLALLDRLLPLGLADRATALWGRRKAEGGRRKAEGGRQKAEGGRMKAEG